MLHVDKAKKRLCRRVAVSILEIHTRKEGVLGDMSSEQDWKMCRGGGGGGGV